MGEVPVIGMYAPNERVRRILVAVLAFALAVGFAFVASTAPAGAAKDEKNYTAEFTAPSAEPTVVGGVTTDYVVKFTNVVDNTVTQKAGTFSVDFGFGFTINAKPTVNAGTHAWEVVSWSNGEVVVSAQSGGERIGVGESVSVSIKATAPSVSQTYTVATAADQEDHGNFRGGNRFTTTSVLRVTVVAVDAGGPYSGNEGSNIAVAGSPGVGGAITGVAWTASGPASCTFANSGAASTTVNCDDNGNYTLTYTVTVGTTSASDTAELTVFNVAPSVSITAPAGGAFFDVGSSVSLTAPFSDPGAADTFTCTIDWGDGEETVVDPATSPCGGSHQYATGDEKTITVTVEDDDGGSDTETVTITIATECNAPCTLSANGKWTGNINTCASPCGYFTTDPTGKLVADITVLTGGGLYMVLTTTDKGPPPGNAYVEVDGKRLPDCGTNGPPTCVHIQRVTGADGKQHTQYEVWWDGDPRFKFG